METTQENIANMLKSGQLSLTELEQMFGSASNNNVTVLDWEICYSDLTDQLTQYCTVNANNSSDPVTGLGLIAYSGDGSTMYCLQYTNGFTSLSISTSVGTNLYTPQEGDQAICVVYGWTENDNFYFTQKLTIGAC